MVSPHIRAWVPTASWAAENTTFSQSAFPKGWWRRWIQVANRRVTIQKYILIIALLEDNLQDVLSSDLHDSYIFSYLFYITLQNMTIFHSLLGCLTSDDRYLDGNNPCDGQPMIGTWKGKGACSASCRWDAETAPQPSATSNPSGGFQCPCRIFLRSLKWKKKVVWAGWDMGMWMGKLKELK